MPAVQMLARYPVKGFGPDILQQIELEANRGVPLDRVYAVENGGARFDPHNPKWLPKANFLMLMRHERLATLTTTFEENGHTLTIFRDEKQVARGSLQTKLGRQLIEQFIGSFMQAELKGPPRIVTADEHHFTDIAAKALHLVNLETVRDLSRVVETDLDPVRFRANVYFDGTAPWAERQWTGKTIRLGTAVLKVFDETGRCEATSVDPASGVRGVSIPSAMQRNLGHTDLGIYAKVLTNGQVRTGDILEVI